MRTVILQQGEDLRALALRELADPARWAEIAEINNLRQPFIVPSWRQEDRRSNTLIWGDQVRIPGRTLSQQRQTPEWVLGADIALDAGEVRIEQGDIAVITAQENIAQAIKFRIHSLRGELSYHPTYGSSVRLAIGLPNGPFGALMCSTWVYEALQAEPRIRTIEAVDAAVEGGVVRVGARVVIAGDNSPTDVNMVLNA